MRISLEKRRTRNLDIYFEESLRHKVYCQSSQRHRQTERERKRKKNCSITKNARANNLSFDSRQSNTEEDEEEAHI